MNLNDIEKFEDAPKSQKMRDGMERWKRGKNRNDYPWNRVGRFLTSRLGQDWDKVVSEFCKLNWVPAEHRTHKQLASYHVEVNTFIEGKEIYYFDKYAGYRGDSQRNVKDYRDAFYVHPETKKLCFQKKIKYVPVKTPETMRILGDFWQLLKLDGIWYEVKGKVSDHYLSLSDKLKAYSRAIGPKDRLIPDYSDKSKWLNLPDIYSITITYQKQLNSKELKKFNLSNDGPKMSGKKCPKCGGYNCRIHLTPN